MILTDETLNERYMKYLARILFEDCICEILCGQTGQTDCDIEKFLTHVTDIIKLNQDPLRLCFSLLINASKLFSVQKNLNSTENDSIDIDTSTKELNSLLLLKVYKKLNSLVNRYFVFKAIKGSLDKDDVFTILLNLMHDRKNHRLYYINLFISLLRFLQRNYHLDLEYKDRRRIYLMGFEMLYELVHNALCYKDNKSLLNTYCLLTGFIIEFVRLCSTTFEDYYFIYKSLCAITLKLFDIVFTRTQLYMIYFIVVSMVVFVSM